MKYITFIESYIKEHQKVIAGLSQQGVSELIQVFENVLNENRQIFVCGNGGSAANASHFITDLSKGASDALEKRFRGMSLNDNSAEPFIVSGIVLLDIYDTIQIPCSLPILM